MNAEVVTTQGKKVGTGLRSPGVTIWEFNGNLWAVGFRDTKFAYCWGSAKTPASVVGYRPLRN